MDNSPFSKLSKELRDMIYEYAPPDPQDIVDISRGQTPPIVITQLCSQMREEAQRASSTPYKLSIGAPPDLVEESGYHVPLPTHLDRLLERGAANVHRLPFLFRSKPTTIELHVVVVVGRGAESADELRTSYGAPGEPKKSLDFYGDPWKRIKTSVQRFTQAIHPHKLTLAFSCTYVSQPMFPCDLECNAFPRSARALSELHVKVAAAGDYQAARSALSKAVEEQKEGMELHQGADHTRCTIRVVHEILAGELENTEEIINIFLEHIFDETAPVLNGTA